MRLDPAHLEHARRVADAILYEGYLLYPYRASAQKNQARFQFGVLVPPSYGAVDECELSASQTECLLECDDDAEALVLVRFLHLQQRIVRAVSPGTGEPHDVSALQVDGTEYTPWDEAAERQQQVAASISQLLRQERILEFHIGAGERSEDLADAQGRAAGQLLRRWAALDGVIRLGAERVAGPYGALRLRVRVENHTDPEIPPRTRDEALHHSLIAAHVLIGVPGGTFLSPTDPPEWAAAETAACASVGTWPVLAGPEGCHDLVLSSPVILYDHPEIAAESAGELFDATEIDEILTLRTLALTDAEKRQARATDPRAADLMDRLDGMPPEMLERMHGAIRYLKATPGAVRPGTGPSDAGPPETGQPGAGPPRGDLAGPDPFGDPILDRPQVPWWDPGSDSSVSPETDHVLVDGVRVARGSRVRMRPGSRRADAQDLFLAGRTALVEAVLHDVDGLVHVAVTPDHDPAADLQRSHGRFLYFAPDEIEPIEPTGPADP
ncbi:MAG TPA: hypothetical protein VH307_14070 [Streptosporangiaceae bacterium]|nr:hypothetical protein [Streptosporangiaceae bacterium]